MAVKMSDQELTLFRDYVVSLCGIRLDEGKRYLLESRLEDLLRPAGCVSYADLYTKAKKGDRTLEKKIVDAVSTNETFFFRDRKTFDLLKNKLVPELLGENLAKPLAIWSAASSTGQEAYSMTIALQEILFDLSKCRIKILGTDISQAAVDAANRGIYSALEMGRGLEEKQFRHFVKMGEQYKIKDELRALCRFTTDNLLSPVSTGPFDIIFCRNVLIYFSPEDKTRVINNLLRNLKSGGCLVVGSTESVLGVTDRLRRMEHQGAIYYVLK
jgi:chemotaxis protein methyltransferase CheR